MYTENALIELGMGYLQDNPERTELYFIGDDIYELNNIDLHVVYSHFENLGYDCYIEESAIENDKYEFEPCKTLVITK